MSQHERSSTRLSSTSTGMRAHVNPIPFPTASGYQITVTGGVPPYTFTPKESPPNPAGVHVTYEGDTAHVTVPAGTPPGTQVFVDVTDSSSSPQTAPTTNSVG